MGREWKREERKIKDWGGEGREGRGREDRGGETVQER